MAFLTSNDRVHVNKQHKLAVVEEKEDTAEEIVNDFSESKIRETVGYFVHLLEKSKQLFNGLRELPQYGQKVWQPYFARTFQVYTKLWKYQQENRTILEKYYNLKRWQIGEIASKIGQLYYHYYLRTSEANYLYESHSFYSAIRARAYYAKAKKEDTSEVMVKKLRYYARYIVVSLLLRKMSLVNDLVKELSKHVDEYRTSFGTEATDEHEWKLVVSEVRTFIGCEQMVNVAVDEAPSDERSNHRLNGLNTPEADRSMPLYLNLDDAIVVGNSSQQAKFSELSLDMFRMLQILEREPQEDQLSGGAGSVSSSSGSLLSASAAPANARLRSQEQSNKSGMSDSGAKRRNPHKYLLYKPTIAQFMTYAVTAFKELSPGSALLIYFSADASLPLSKKDEEEAQYENGGVSTNAAAKEGDSRSRRTGAHEIHCVHPGDLLPITRKPLFIVVDSPNAVAFGTLTRLFNQPLVILMAPSELPGAMSDLQSQGGLLTAFLFDPVAAFVYVCSLSHVSANLWNRCSETVRRFVNEANKLFVKSRNLHHDFIQFYGDDFLRTILLRFVFCCVCLRMHRAFKGPSYLPSSRPEMPQSELLTHESLVGIITELASILDMTALFLDAIKT